MSRPPRAIRPPRTGSRPMTPSMVVVLPAPLRPTRHTDSRSPTAKDRLRSTWAGPRKTFSPSIASMGQSVWARAARGGAGAGVEAELLGPRHRLVPHRGVGVREREQPPRAALAGEDRERHVVVHAELIEQVDELEAPRDAELDLAVDGGARDVRALELDAPGVGRDETADQIDQGRLACPVGADEGQHLARGHREIHVVHRVGLPEGLAELGGLEDVHAQPALTGRTAKRRTVPTIPAGRASTSTTSTMPSTICQYTVWPTA